jgi:hypothetical protein
MRVNNSHTCHFYLIAAGLVLALFILVGLPALRLAVDCGARAMPKAGQAALPVTSMLRYLPNRWGTARASRRAGLPAACRLMPRVGRYRELQANLAA